VIAGDEDLLHSSVPNRPAHETLPALLRDAAVRFENREYLVLGERRVTFADAERTSAEWARGLLALGLGKGARVGILMPNNPDWVLAFLAAGRIGALTVTLSTLFQPPEISWGVRHNDIDTLLVVARYLSNDYLDKLEQALPGLASQMAPELYLPEHPYLRRIIVWGECDRPWALRGPQALSEAAAAKPQVDEALLAAIELGVSPADSLLTICTSGTSAAPKSVIHTHGSALRAVHLFTGYQDLLPEDRTYSGQAFFWIGGQNSGVLPPLFVGSCLCLAPTPRPADVVEVIRLEQVTRLSLWPAQAVGIAEYVAKEGLDLPSVRSGYGEPRDEHGQVIPPDRRPGGWLGMTESFGMHSLDRRPFATRAGKGGTWGRSLPGVERAVVDPETRRRLSAGEVGELYIRGHTLMQGYYKVEREAIFTCGGWFPTGDLVSIDEDDYLRFHGRNSELIKTAGANVSPSEVERALAAQPGVREAIVFGLPDPVKGEIVFAVAVPFADCTLDPGTLRETLRQGLSAYKVPQQIIVMSFDEVPRTGSDKVFKRGLAERLAPLLALVGADDTR
jgi:acyl-CoA synthetase (AMP-forming)/AMP-acid ligase II